MFRQFFKKGEALTWTILRAPSRSVNLYTRTGDKGTSALFNNERLPKDDVTFEALGAIDTVSAHIGLSRAFLDDLSRDLRRDEEVTTDNNGNVGELNHTASFPTSSDANTDSNTESSAESQRNLIADLENLNDQLETVQCRLLDLGAHVATPLDSPASDPRILDSFSISAEHTGEVESWIDALSSMAPPLRAFILPSGGAPSAALHVARTHCRTAERRVVPLVRAGKVAPEVARYVNRLSDFLFAAARFAAVAKGEKEREYSRRSVRRDQERRRKMEENGEKKKN